MSPFYDPEFLRIVSEETGRRMEILRWGDTWWPAYRRFGVWRPLAEGIADDLDPIGDPTPFISDSSIRAFIPDSRLSASNSGRWAKSIGPAWRTTIRPHLRRDLRQGKFDIQINPPHAFETLVRLHSLRWRKRFQPGAFVGWRGRVHRRWSTHPSVRITVATLNGIPVGALYGMFSQDRFLYYQAGIDPQCPGSPGTALIGEAMDFCEQHDIPVFDFLRGSEPYKLRWNPDLHTPIGNLVVGRGAILTLEAEMRHCIAPLKLRLEQGSGLRR